jgi:hypothetical protein
MWEGSETCSMVRREGVTDRDLDVLMYDGLSSSSVLIRRRLVSGSRLCRCTSSLCAKLLEKLPY